MSAYDSADVSRRCRDCGRKLASVKMPVEKFEDDLLVVLGLDIRHDVADSGGTFMHFLAVLSCTFCVLSYGFICKPSAWMLRLDRPISVKHWF